MLLRSNMSKGFSDSEKGFADRSQKSSVGKEKDLGFSNNPLTLILLQKYCDTSGRRIAMQVVVYIQLSAKRRALSGHHSLFSVHGQMVH